MSSMFHLTLLHCCCHSRGIPWYWHLKKAGFFCCNWAPLLPIAYHEAKPQLFLMITSVLGVQLPLKYTFTNSFSWPLTVSSLNSSLHSFIPSNQYHLGDTSILPSLAACKKYSLDVLWSIAYLCSQQIFPRRFHCCDGDFFLVTPIFLVLDDHNQISTQSKILL